MTRYRLATQISWPVPPIVNRHKGFPDRLLIHGHHGFNVLERQSLNLGYEIAYNKQVRRSNLEQEQKNSEEQEDIPVMIFPIKKRTNTEL